MRSVLWTINIEKMSRIIISVMVFFGVLSLRAQTNGNDGDVKATDLNEVIVRGENVWVDGNKTVFIPNKRAKNLAKDMVSLVERMHMGIILVEDGEIRTGNGQTVNIFINGVPADGLDISTFWPKNAMRVEYMETSDDPRFLGKGNILNFVMKDYVAGGLTKIDGSQEFPNNGEYSAASKLVWGKMTYNAMAKGGYSRDHLSGSDRTETYDDVWFSGSHYDRIMRQECSGITSRSNNIYGGLNARYRTDKIVMTHRVALQWNENPGSGSHGFVSYSPLIIESNEVNTFSCSRSLSPSIDGKYNFFPGGKWSYSAGWFFNHSHNNNQSSYTDTGLPSVVTISRENMYVYGLELNTGFNAGSNMVMMASFKERRNISSVCYSGSSDSRQWQSSGESCLEFLWWYQPVRSVTFKVTPQITLYDWNVNHTIKETNWMPGVNAVIFWSINRKNNISFNSWYYQTSPVSSQRNDLIIRETELKWLEGNPYMGSSDSYWLSLDYNTYPWSWLRSSLSVNLIMKDAEPTISYRSGGSNRDGVIGQYGNSVFQKTMKAYWNVGVTLFEGAISIGNSLTYDYSIIEDGGRLGYFRARPYISWDFGNCSLGLNYGSPERFFSNGGEEEVKTPHYYGLNFSYGNGNIILDFSVNEPFNKHLTTHRLYSGSHYSFEGRDWRNGHKLSVSLTYTFDYGKKVTPGIDISEQNIRSTSVLGSER